MAVVSVGAAASAPEQGRKLKYQCLMQSRIPDQYCLGVPKLQRKDQAELKKLQGKFAVGTCLAFTKVELLNEKSADINTACRIAIDLRLSTDTAMLKACRSLGHPRPRH